MQQIIEQSIEVIASRLAAADLQGLEGLDVERFKRRLNLTASIIAHLGMRIVPADSVSPDPNVYKALLTLAKAQADGLTVCELSRGDE